MASNCSAAFVLIFLVSHAMGADAPARPPDFGMASINQAGVIRCTYTYWKPIVEQRVKSVGKGGEVKMHQYSIAKLVPIESLATLEQGSFEVQNAKGESLTADDLKQRLAKPAPVLYLFKGNKLDDNYRQLLKDDVLILFDRENPESEASRHELAKEPSA